MFISQGCRCQKSENRSQTQLKKKSLLHAEVLFLCNVVVENWKLDFEGLVSKEAYSWENAQTRRMKLCASWCTKEKWEMKHGEQQRVRMATNHLTLITWLYFVAAVWGHRRWWTPMCHLSTFMCSCIQANAKTIIRQPHLRNLNWYWLQSCSVLHYCPPAQKSVFLLFLIFKPLPALAPPPPYTTNMQPCGHLFFSSLVFLD